VTVQAIIEAFIREDNDRTPNHNTVGSSEFSFSIVSDFGQITWDDVPWESLQRDSSKGVMDAPRSDTAIGCAYLMLGNSIDE
jgi:hypothetical protein